MTDYSRIPEIVDQLLAEGVHPSARRVRAKLGSGSHETIQQAIANHLRSLGRLPEEAQEDISVAPLALPAHRPEVDSEAVKVRLEVLRLETHTILAEADAERF